jgi:hypothetical protein
MKASRIISQSLSLSLSVKPAVEEKPSPEKTADGYELRSRGPARRGLGALDKKFPIPQKLSLIPSKNIHPYLLIY